MVEFYPDGEFPFRSEKLDVAWHESLVVKVGSAACGHCRTRIANPEEQVCCSKSGCNTTWKQAIYLETTTKFRHHYLPMIGRSAVRGLQKPEPNRPPHMYPNIRSRHVTDIKLVGDFL